jgi:hypothetical protein
MTVRNFSINFVFIFLSKLLFAQNEIIVTGKVLEDSSFAGVPFANIIFKQTDKGFVADAKGAFSLTVDTSHNYGHLIFSAIGYESKVISVDSLISTLNGIVIVKARAYDIPVVQIEGLTAKQIIKKTIDMIPENYASDTFYSKCFYRQYHEENNFYVRLIEATLYLKNTSSKNKNSVSDKERCRVLQLRRSNNYEMNGEKHGDHFFDLLSENPVYHASGTVLNSKALNSFKFLFGSDENDSMYHIFYSEKNSGGEKIQKGELFIDKRTFAIIKFTKEEQPNDGAFVRYPEVKSVPYRWEFQNGKVIAEYKYYNGKMFLASLCKTYTHQLYDNKVNAKEYLVTENFELKIDSNFYSRNFPCNFNFSAVSNLYYSHYAYDRNFWNNCSLPEFIFENSKNVIDDLERKEIMEKQFTENSAQTIPVTLP